MKCFRILICVLILISTLSACGVNKGNFTLLNNSDESISRVAVTICGQTVELKDIYPGQQMVGAYQVESDSGVKVYVKFKSGKTIIKEDGYVTNGKDFSHRINVSNSEVDITTISL